MRVSSHADMTEWVRRTHFQPATSMHWHAAYSDGTFFQSVVSALLDVVSVDLLVYLLGSSR